MKPVAVNNVAEVQRLGRQHSEGVQLYACETSALEGRNPILTDERFEGEQLEGIFAKHELWAACNGTKAYPCSTCQPEWKAEKDARRAVAR